MSTELTPSWQLLYGGTALIIVAMGAAIIYGFATGIGEWYDAVVGVLILLIGVGLAITTFTGPWG